MINYVRNEKAERRNFLYQVTKNLQQQKRAIAIVIISKMRFIRAFAVSHCELRGLIFDIFVGNFVAIIHAWPVNSML